MRKKHLGLTLIEITAVLAVMAIAAALAIPRLEEIWSERIVNHAASRVHDVMTAARRYRVDNNAWPANTTQLRTGGYLTNEGAQAPLGGAYSFTNMGSNLRISFNAGQSKYANRLMARLPYADVVSSTTVRTEITIPGHEATYDALRNEYYHRDGSRPLTGPLAGGNQNAVNLNTIEMRRIVDRDDITKVLDPSHMSTILDLTARNVTAVNVNATNVGATTVTATTVNSTNLTASNQATIGTTRTTNLRVTRSATAGGACNAASTGNIAVGSTGILSCVGNVWTAPPTSSYHQIWPVNIHTASMSSGTRTMTLPASLPTAHDALTLSVVCSSGNQTRTQRVQIADNTGGPWTSVVAAHVEGSSGVAFNNQVVVQNRYPTLRRLYVRMTEGNCQHGLYVEVAGWWG